MKKVLFVLLIALCGATGLRAADGDLFPYPKAPEELTMLNERCDYIVSHFWDRAVFKTAFSSRDKLNACFGDWVGLMPYASADTVRLSIRRFLRSHNKEPKNILAFARMAEGWLYSDTCEVFSEELYYPFASAVAANKKIPAADRLRFENQVAILNNSALNATMQPLKFRTPEGLEASLGDITTPNVLLFFNDPDCDECNMARIRLSADVNANALINAGILTIVSITPDEADDEWLAATASYPSNWTVGAMPDADRYFDLRFSPEFMLLDSKHRVVAKRFTTDQLKSAFITMRENAGL